MAETLDPALVEKAARAIAVRFGDDPYATSSAWRYFLNEAEAALSAVIPDIRADERGRCLRAVSTLPGYSTELERAHAAIREASHD